MALPSVEYSWEVSRCCAQLSIKRMPDLSLQMIHLRNQSSKRQAAVKLRFTSKGDDDGSTTVPEDTVVISILFKNQGPK